MELTEKQKKATAITRKEYKDIKKLDRTQMQNVINNIYLEGYKEGLKSSSSVRPEDIYKLLIETKGIGTAKAQAAMEKITQLFEVYN